MAQLLMYMIMRMARPSSPTMPAVSPVLAQSQLQQTLAYKDVDAIAGVVWNARDLQPAPVLHVSIYPATAAGVEKVDVDLASKKVVVRGNVTKEAVKEKVAKTGLPTEYWS